MNRKFTVPNIVTTIGIIAIVFYIFAFINNETPLLFTALTIIALSDLFDGFLARKLKQETICGKFLDYLRDRFFQIAVIGNLIWLNQWHSIYGATLIIALELSLIITLLPSVLFKEKSRGHLLLKIKQGSYLASIFYLYRAAIII